MGKVKKKRRSNGDGKRIFRSPKGVHHVCRKKALAAPLFLTTSARRQLRPKMNPGSALVFDHFSQAPALGQNDPWQRLRFRPVRPGACFGPKMSLSSASDLDHFVGTCALHAKMHLGRPSFGRKVPSSPLSLYTYYYLKK